MDILHLVKIAGLRRAKKALEALPWMPGASQAHAGPQPVSSAPPARSLPSIRFLLLALALASMLLWSPPAGAQTDTTAPSFLATSTHTRVGGGGVQVNLAFNEDLDGSNLPLKGAFVITADGSAVQVTRVELNSISSQVLELHHDPPIGRGQVVRVSYTDPTSGDDTEAIQDAAGNDAASFTDVDIENRSNLPSVPQNLTATKGTGLVKLSWTPPTGVTITGYDYRVSTDRGVSWGSWTSIPNSGSLTSYDVTGLTLTPDTHFTFQLRAVNTHGDGPAAQTELLPGVTLSDLDLEIREGSEDTYTIVLDALPTANVTVDITAGGDVTTSPTNVDFTTQNWGTPQTVTVNAGQDDDGVNDEVTITHSAARSNAAEYAALTNLPSVDVTVLDDEETVNICDRTWWLRDGILRQTPADDSCHNITRTELGNITELDFSGLGPGHGGVFHNHLKHDDLRGLSGLTRLDLSGLGLGTFEHADGNFSSFLPVNMFLDLEDLEYLSLADNNIYPRLHSGTFAGLETSLTELDLRGFSHIPGRDRATQSVGSCWTDEQEARLHPQYPWNPRTGSPEAFSPLTSLETYNWDADFDTSIPGFSYTPEPYATDNYPVFVDAPTGLTAQPAAEHVGLRWQAPAGVTGIIGYRIERDVNGVGGSLLLRMPSSLNRGPRNCLPHTWIFQQFDRLGKRVGFAREAEFVDHIADLHGQELRRAESSLKYHVFAVTADGESLPVTVDVPLDSFRDHPGLGFAVQDASVYEGRDKSNNLNTLDFEVMMTGGQREQVDYHTTSGTATGGTGCSTGIDFISASGTLTFHEPGNLQTAKVTVCDDSVEDSWETLQLVLSNPTGGVAIRRSTATGLIINSENNNPATGAPTVSGTAEAGQTLTASTAGIADADGLDDPGYEYQWIANDGTADADIQDATGETYEVTDADVGKTIKVRVSFTDDADNEETLTSAATAAVAARLTVTVTLAPPSTHDGSTEFTFDIRFSEEPKADFSYQVLKFHAFDVTGGTVLRAQRLQQDPQSNIPWRITVKPGGNGNVTVVLPVTTDCAADGAVCTEDDRKLSNRLELTVNGPNSQATGLPTISGTPQAGQTLTVSTDGIADADGLDAPGFEYQWIANDGSADADIQDATGETYEVTDADVGKTIKVKVSFTDDRKNVETLTSAATAAVTARPNNPATGAPTISGTAQAGQTLTASTTGIADADGLDDPDFEYQWLADDANIQDATGETYEVTDADVGKTIKVKVTFTDDRKNVETLTSVATAVVTAAPSDGADTEEEGPIWSATLTAGTLSFGHGYDAVFKDPPVGELSSTSFEIDGETYTVNQIAAGWYLYIGLDKELPSGSDFTLEVDGAGLDSADATSTSFSWGHLYKWDEAEIEWEEGDTVELRLFLTD